MNILVLDVGTSSMRGTLLDAAFQVLFRKQIKYQPTYGEGGFVEQDPQDWLGASAVPASIPSTPAERWRGSERNVRRFTPGPDACLWSRIT